MDAMCSNGEFRGREPNSLHAIGGNRDAFCGAEENVKSRFASGAGIRVFLTDCSEVPGGPRRAGLNRPGGDVS
jgi:hypothetical protein